MKRPVLILFTAIAACTIANSSARACNGCGWGDGYGLGYLYNSLSYNVPYFAAFPPVYYSYPVPRTYGYSPFAYPPGVMTPDVVMPVAPQEIINPHVPSTPNGPSGQLPLPDRTTAVPPQPAPLAIINPFVAQGQSVVQADSR